MEMNINVTTILNVAGLGPNSETALYGPVNLKDAVKCTVTGECSFRNNQSNARVQLFSSYDNTNYDTEPIAQWDIPVNKSQTVRTTIALLPDFYFVKAKFQNLDANETIDNCKVIITYAAP